MPQIVPMRDLKDTNKICEKAQSLNEPIFVTKNGYGALVVMSIETYERNYAASEVRRKLREAEESYEKGAELTDGFVVLDKLRKKYAE